MTAPAFLNNGARSDSSTTGVNSLTAAAPASRANKNLLILEAGFWSSGTNSNTAMTLSGGDAANWIALTQYNINNGGASGGFRGAIWLRVVDGTESIPTVNYPAVNPTYKFAQVQQFTANYPANAVLADIVGASNHNAAAGSTVTVNGVTNTKANSLNIYILLGGNTSAFATPAGWTEDLDNGALFTQNAAGHKSGVASGGASGNISVASTQTFGYVAWQIELLEVVTAPKTAAVSEAIVAGASQDASIVKAATRTEAIAPAASVSASSDRNASVSEAIVPGVSATAANQTAASLTEAIAPGQASSAVKTELADVTETISPGDAATALATRTGGLSEGINPGETASASAEFAAAVTEAVALGSASSAQADFAATITEGIALDVQQGVSLITAAAAAEAMTLGASSSGALLASASWTDELTLGAVVSAMRIAPAAAVESISLGDQATASLIANAATAEAIELLAVQTGGLSVDVDIFEVAILGANADAIVVKLPRRATVARGGVQSSAARPEQSSDGRRAAQDPVRRSTTAGSSRPGSISTGKR